MSSATCDVPSGAPPFDEICRLAQTIPADLVVMPTHGRTGLKHVFLGSTAERIVCFRRVRFSSRAEALFRRTMVHDSGLKPSLSRSTFPSAHGKGFATRFRLRLNLGPRSFCCMPRISDTSIAQKALPSTTFPVCKKAAQKTAERKMRELGAVCELRGRQTATAFTDGSPVIDICADEKSHDAEDPDHYVNARVHRFHTCSYWEYRRARIDSAPSGSAGAVYLHVRAANLAKLGCAKADTNTGRQAATTNNHRDVRRSL